MADPHNAVLNPKKKAMYHHDKYYLSSKPLFFFSRMLSIASCYRLRPVTDYRACVTRPNAHKLNRSRLNRSPLRILLTTPSLKNLSSPAAFRPPMYIFSIPRTSRKPSLLLSLPRLRP